MNQVIAKLFNNGVGCVPVELTDASEDTYEAKQILTSRDKVYEYPKPLGVCKEVGEVGEIDFGSDLYWSEDGYVVVYVPDITAKVLNHVIEIDKLI